MSGPKAALKAIGAAIKSQKYDDAIQEAQKLLAADPKSYQGYVVSLDGPLSGHETDAACCRSAADSLKGLYS
jgi:hypothetical protein